MRIFNESIDEAIRELLKQMKGFPVSVWSREFLDGYRAYCQKERGDFYSLVLPDEAPQRRMSKIDDNTLRPKLDRIFAAMEMVVQAVRVGKIPIDKTLSEMWRQFSWPADFKDKDYSDAFHNAVKWIVEYEKYQYADRIDNSISIQPKLECYYDKDEGLLDVTSFEPQREAFIEKDSRLAVIPKYKSDYGLKEIFAQLFRKGIPENWRVWIAPARIIDAKDVSKTAYIQEEKIFGPKFNEEAFKEIFSKAYGVFQYTDNKLPDSLMRVPLYQLQYQIEPNEKEGKSSAIIEELIDITYEPNVNALQSFVYGPSEHFYVRHRMIHLMYDFTKSKFIHIDLSHLYYNESDYFKRIDQTLGQTKPSATKKMKVYKIDGEIPFDVVSNLIGISLDWVHNPEVQRLLNGE